MKPLLKAILLTPPKPNYFGYFFQQLIKYQNDLNDIIIDKNCAIRIINENISYTQFSTTHITTLFAEKKKSLPAPHSRKPVNICMNRINIGITVEKKKCFQTIYFGNVNWKTKIAAPVCQTCLNWLGSNLLVFRERRWRWSPCTLVCIQVYTIHAHCPYSRLSCHAYNQTHRNLNLNSFNWIAYEGILLKTISFCHVGVLYYLDNLIPFPISCHPSHYKVTWLHETWWLYQHILETHFSSSIIY